MKQKKNTFKYIVLSVVLLIPFMYSFFYLKAYWDPYGKGNIDNIPVAIVNKDKGDKGNSLVQSIQKSKKLKIFVLSEKKASDGLNDGKYYAIINIPETFTSDMKSAAEQKKRHATITYSPNQKSNYLASQIINNVVNVVEKNLDNQVNKQIVSTLSNKLNEVPSQLETMEDGFGKLENGSLQLQNGSNTLNNGIQSLQQNYQNFHQGVSKVHQGVSTLNQATSSFSNLNHSVDDLISGVSNLKTGEDNFHQNLNHYVAGVQQELKYTTDLAKLVKSTSCPGTNAQEVQMCQIATGLLAESPVYQNQNLINYLDYSGSKLIAGNTMIQTGLTTLNAKVSNLNQIKPQIATLQSGIQQLATGTQTLYNSSIQIKGGIDQLSTGSNTLYQGIATLHGSVSNAKTELNSNINRTKGELKKLNGISDYSESPITMNTTEVNKISSYGTAFSPFFISIALWVGSLMMFIVLYYDKESRFKILGMENKNRVQRTLCYHALTTTSAIILGLLLYFLLDFEITNMFLYFISIILTANCFMAIIEFLIENLNDVGKFIALILLVLQLAAAGGTFPIETVTKGFRWMHSLLPMTYTVRLLREPLISIESNLLTKNLIVVISIFIFFLILNLIIDIYKQKHQK